jgi:subtilisin family serine protease
MKYLFLVFLLSFNYINAQEKYWVSFKNKANVCFDPQEYFFNGGMQKKSSETDSTDFPVNQNYLNAVSEKANALSWSSRWLNGVAVFANENAIEEIRKFTFVKSAEKMYGKVNFSSMSEKEESNLSNDQLSLLKFQIFRMQGDSFIDKKIDGSGIRIAVFDAGFPDVDKHPAFKHLRDGNKIIKTYDFVSKKENVYRNHWHGTATLSCIAGKIDSLNIGLATGAEFLLARTEKAFTEPFSEEENWLAAAEWAYKNGAKIISSSLGYTYQRYFNTEMDGHTSLVAQAATIAASKGILVINAAGNEGNNAWRFINTPADADSVLSVGGTDPETDLHIYFSSYGPASDWSLKPNVCTVAKAIVAKKNGLSKESGTSFSTPLIAGFAACAWQTKREWSNMELFDALEKSAHLYPYYDYAHGFGIPQASYFISEEKIPETTFDFVIINNDIKIILREKYSYPETELALGYNVKRNFFYKVEDKDGRIKKYTVLLADRKEMLHFLAEDFQIGDVLTVHFEGYTSTIDFPGEIK